jgi:hypothetical protein
MAHLTGNVVREVVQVMAEKYVFGEGTSEAAEEMVHLLQPG